MRRSRPWPRSALAPSELGRACRRDRQCTTGRPAAECSRTQAPRLRNVGGRSLAARPGSPGPSAPWWSWRPARLEGQPGRPGEVTILRLLRGEPVPEAYAFGSHALHARDAVVSSGASRPLSAASTASFRTTVIRTLMETAPSPRAPNTTRQAATVALVKPRRASWDVSGRRDRSRFSRAVPSHMPDAPAESE
jgi:hypothetical protein